jgi:hypothetical protein
MAKKVRALNPTAARRIRAEIEKERIVRAAGFEPAARIEDGSRVQKWARKHIADTIGLRPDLLD